MSAGQRVVDALVRIPHRVVMAVLTVCVVVGLTAAASSFFGVPPMPRGVRLTMSLTVLAISLVSLLRSRLILRRARSTR